MKLTNQPTTYRQIRHSPQSQFQCLDIVCSFPHIGSAGTIICLNFKEGNLIHVGNRRVHLEHITRRNLIPVFLGRLIPRPIGTNYESFHDFTLLDSVT